MRAKKGETVLPCGCRHDDRIYFAMCDAHRAAWRMLHELAGLDHRMSVTGASTPRGVTVTESATQSSADCNAPSAPEGNSPRGNT
jgi:hypothetical protein